MSYVPTIGLEVHVQLDTHTKLFCGCATDYAGAPPNTHTCPVCLGHPGVLPVLNEAVLEKAVQVVAALGGRVQESSRFDRKNYFYPDMPKAYQISQFASPIGLGGEVMVEVPGGAPRPVRLRRVHMEEDAGKLIHSEDGSGALVDYNRAGVPLLEIVSEPDLGSPDEARRYLERLKAVLEYLEASDCNMEEGSLRCDANVSLSKVPGQLGTRCEIKNMNSFRNVARALAYEIERQRALLDEGGEVAQETRLWDDAGGRTRAMRSKEESEDYRYFPEPDLPPVELDPARVAALRAALPELPDAKCRRFVEEFGLSQYDAEVLTQTRDRARWFEAARAARPVSPKALCNWITSELLGRLGEASITEAPVTPAALAELVALVEAGEIHGKQAKQVFEEMFASGDAPEVIRRRLGMENLTDEAAIRALVATVVEGNADSVAAYRAGKGKVVGFLVGQVMKASRGAASPQIVDRILREELDS